MPARPSLLNPKSPREFPIRSSRREEPLLLMDGSVSLHHMGSREYIALWSEVPLFKTLPKEMQPALARASQPVRFDKGQKIFEQGDEGDAFYVICSGSADVIIDNESTAVLRAGDYFGEQALLNGEPRQATVLACTDIEAIKLTRDKFFALGIHQHVQFPRRNKVKSRHLMMAAGLAGVRATPESRVDVTMPAFPHSEGEGDIHIPKSYSQSQVAALHEMFCDWMHLSIFVLVPLALVCKQLELSPGIVFTTNFIAIVPLASLLGAATEALAAHTGQLLGGLLNATFGNAVEMIMCIQAVKHGLINVVQGNLLGSILSNLLLVLGMSIIASGLQRRQQTFNVQGASANMTCQLVASISVSLPTVFAAVAGTANNSVLKISRVCSILLMGLYGMFLFFMLSTHADLFSDDGEEEDEKGSMSTGISATVLCACTVAVYFCTESLVASIEGVSNNYGLSQAFIGVILLPIVGNACEHTTAVTSAYKGMMDLALGVAVGSSTQIALFVVPCAVLFGWYYDQPMTLNFTVFDTVCQLLTVFLVSQVLSLGTTTWLHGVMLTSVYAFIAIQTLFLE